MKNFLSHADIEAILKEGPKAGTLRKAYMAHAEFEPRLYGFYDQDNIGKDTSELPTHAIDSAGFGRSEQIALKLPKNPIWVDKLWNAITVMPNGRLSSNVLEEDPFNIEMTPYIIGDVKEDSVLNRVSPRLSVIAESFYVKTKLDRDDILDLADFDVVSYIKGLMQNSMKHYLAKAFIRGAATSTSIIPIGFAVFERISIDENDILSYSISDKTDSNMTLLISRSAFNTAMTGKGIASLSDIAEIIGVREIIPIPDDVMPPGKSAIYMDLSSYCVGLPKGIDGDFFSDFDIDYNTYKVMLETKVCALPCKLCYSTTAQV